MNILGKKNIERTFIYDYEEWKLFIEQEFDNFIIYIYETNSLNFYQYSSSFENLYSNEIFKKCDNINEIISLIIQSIDNNNFKIEKNKKNNSYIKFILTENNEILNTINLKKQKNDSNKVIKFLINEIILLKKELNKKNKEIENLKEKLLILETNNSQINQEKNEIINKNLGLKIINEVLHKKNIENGEEKIKEIERLDFEKEDEENYIIAKYKITKEDLYKEIQILNYNNSIDNSNQKALENCCQIYLNNEKIDFHFKYKFNKEGEYIFNIKFNNSILKNISCLFSNCTTLIEIDFSNFNTINIKDMNSMFSNCSSLKNLDLKNFKTDNLEDMYSMFSDCSSLLEINLTSFNTKNVNDMSYMFSKCSSLINLNVSNFDTRNVTDMSYMFAECYSLSNLNLINFNVEKVNDMSYMFQDCKSLNVLDLSNFKTNKNNCIYKIFNGLSLKCSIITKDKRLLYKRKTYLY